MNTIKIHLWLSASVVSSILAGCAADTSSSQSDPTQQASEAISEGNIDADRPMTDNHLTGDQNVTAAQVQKFLDYQGSALAGYTDSKTKESAATIIASLSEKESISPVYMLARIETESALISSGNLNYIDSATGCACPDSGTCNPSDGGFYNQIKCAATLMRGYLNDLARTGETVSGWRVGVRKDTLDPCAITPANQATAALYTYTPWVGAYSTSGCGADVGGTSLLAVNYNQYALYFGGPTCTLAGHDYVENTCTESWQCSDGKWVNRLNDPAACDRDVEPNGACVKDDGQVVPQNTCTATLQCDDGEWVDRLSDPHACR